VTAIKRILFASSIAAALVALPIGASATGDDRAIVHILNRLGYGPTAAAIEQVKRAGIGAYIDAQLHPERLADTAMAARLAGFATLAKSSRELAEEYFLPAMLERRGQKRQPGQAPEGAVQPTGESNPEPRAPNAESRPPARTPEQMQMMRMQRAVVGELSQQRILRAAYSEKQLEEVLVDFWMNHFNVFVGKGQVRLYLSEYERDVVRPRVLGKFRDLLGATAQSPAMLFYLDNWQSTAPAGAPTSADAQRNRDASRRHPARIDPLMHQRRRLPGSPNTADDPMARVPPPAARTRGVNENYARELMELHTLGVDGGYTQKDVQEVARAFTGWTIANPRQGGGFLFDPRRHDDGEKIVLGQRIKAGGGRKDGEAVLDLLARHPSTARFIATKLARRFVADEPPPALIDRAARRFKETDGDLREVVRTIVTSPEFLDESARRAKTKSPYEFVVSAVRVSGLDVANAMPLVQSLRDLGMPLYGAQPPTGYPDKAEAWVNSGALLNRMNFAITLAGGQLRALGAPVPRASTAEETRRMLTEVALAGDVSASTAATVARATTPGQALALILGSPEFQKR
jgi:uncharacterized protein (DUF1800 family)